ncbi:MAG: hypothetical protein U0939_17650 [Pirellulales bacterium]
MALQFPVGDGSSGHAVVLTRSPSGNLFIIDGQSNVAYNAHEAAGEAFLRSRTVFEAVTFP